MANYKDTNNQIHFLDSEEFEYLLPAGSIKITDEEAALVILQNQPEVPLDILRAEALSKIDAEAGRTRSKYLTSIPGQDATYIAKQADCVAFAAAGYPADTSIYQWVQAEADATGLTPQEAADAILIQAAQWRVLGSAIEKVRRGGKIDIEKKIKASTINASLAATIAALQSL